MKNATTNTALLIMDYQNLILENTDAVSLVPTTAGVRKRAKEAGIRIIYVTVGFRAGYPEVGDGSPAFATARDNGILQLGNQDQAIHAGLTPDPDDVVVVKHRRGPFHATDLDQILRINGIETIVLAGVSTSGVTLTTVRNAADLDYRVIVLSDCCADKDPEVHRVLLEKVFPTQAEVMTSDEWVRSLDEG